MEKKLKLQRSETFYIREGWIEKVFMACKDKAMGAFSSKKGIGVFGIGSNMVKSLKYWVGACCLVDSFNDPFSISEEGKLLMDNDPYMESLFSIGFQQTKKMLLFSMLSLTIITGTVLAEEILFLTSNPISLKTDIQKSILRHYRRI